MVKEWKEATLEELCVPNGLVRGPFGGALKKEIFVSSGYKVYEQRNAIYATTEIGRYYISDEKYQELQRFAISDGDFIVSCSGTIGCIYRLPPNSPSGVINQALLKITIDNEQIDTELFQQYFRSEPFQKSIIDDTQGGAMKNLIGMDKFRKILFVIPVTIPEQRAIAAALSDADSYISALEKLIAKKRNIKQGAMKELLMGKRRLARFTGKWVAKQLGDCFDKYRGIGLSKNVIIPDGENECILYGELFTQYNEIIREVVSRTNETSGFYSQEGDLLLPGSTTTTGRDLATASVILKSNVLLGGDLIVFRPNIKIDSRFVSYAIPLYANEIVKYTQGITIVHLQGEKLLSMDIKLPPTFEEQTAIAAILSDMDAEIDKLTAKLNKARQIKQGMMQELLTGRIRLLEQTAFPESVPNVKIVKLPKQEKNGHNQQFDDAVMIAGIVNALYSDKYPLGRKKVQKCLYLLRRHQDENTSAFKKKAAGPYADEIRYKGGEPIAKSAHYITTTTVKGKGTTFAPGNEISKAFAYIKNWNKQNDIKWVTENLKYKRVDDLELLATVDMAICDLEEAGTAVSVSTIKHLIATNKEWKAKLEKRTFSDTNIARAIRELQTLLSGGN